MEHQVLARKWRPRTFEQMVGQEHVLKALVNALDNDRLHHAYLFTGTRGVGKTTIARILAKCLNCEAGVTSVPCNTCSTCTEINEGRCVDLIEVDAASKTKVEDTRELLDNVQYAPTRCRYKVYLIDEVHMLSGHSFNALLKTLEEPPPHIKFLLATTDPQKLPVTVLSRCLQFNLKNLPPEPIVEHLKLVLSEENVTFEEPALWQLGRAADGSMRDALSLADQAIAYGENTVKEIDVGAMLGSMDRKRLYHLLTALLEGNASGLLAQVAEIANYSPDYVAALDELISLLHRIAVAQAVPDMADNSFGDLDRIQMYAADMNAEMLQLYYQIALIGRRDLPLNPDLRAGFEMVLLRMLAFTFDPDGSTVEPKKKVTDNSPDNPQRPVAPEPGTNAQISASVSNTSSSGRENGPLGALRAVAAREEQRPKLDLVVNNERAAALAEQPLELVQEQEETHEVKPEEISKPAEVIENSVGLEQLNSNREWIQAVMQIPLRGMTKNILMQCVFVAFRDKQIRLAIDPQYIELVNDAHKQRIVDALIQYFSTTLTVQIDAGTITQETAMAYQQRKKEERQALARQSLEQDPLVQQIVERFDAQINVDSIEPKD